MSEKVRIVIDSFDPYRENFALWSRLYVEIGEDCFPCASWTDATSSVLSMWLHSINRYLLGNTDTVTLPFMDGDYAMQLEALPNGEALLRCTNGDAVTTEQEIDVLYFARQLLAAVGKIEKQYEAHTDTPQIRELLSLANNLRNTINK